MADHDSKSKQKAAKKNAKKRKPITDGDGEGAEGGRPLKACRSGGSEREAGQGEGSEKLEEDGTPWRNLQLILLLQSKDVDIEKKIGSAFHYVKSRVREKVDDDSQGFEAISISRVIAFLNNWVQSLLISCEKKIRADGDISHALSCFDCRCWEILKFSMEEALELHVPLSISRDMLRVIHCIAKDALNQLNNVSVHPVESGFSGGKPELYSMVLDCISLVFSFHGGVSNENIELWVSIIVTVLKLVQKIILDKLSDSKFGIFVLQFTRSLLEPFTKFLRVHPTRKNGFQYFIDKLLEPLLHLLDILHLDIDGSNPEWTRNLLKLVEEVVSQGLFHPFHIDGFLSLQCTGKYKTFDEGKSNDWKTAIKSYHRHLFDKLEKIIAGKKDLALGGLGELFRLFVNCVKNQKNVSIGGRGSSVLEDDRSNCLNAETRKSLFDFSVQIMEPLLLEINNLQAELEVGSGLLDVHRALMSTNKLLVVFVHENIYSRMEDASEGACVNFLKVVYDMIMSLSAKIDQLQQSNFGLDEKGHGEVFNLIAKQLVAAVRYLLKIEYEVIGDDLESIWVMMFAHGHSFMDVLDASSVTSELLHLGCELVNLYSELRQVNKPIFALCKAMRRLTLPVRDEKTSANCYDRNVKRLGALLCSKEFRLSIYNAIKSVPEGQASGCIRQLTEDITESLEWIKVNCSLTSGNELGKLNVSCSSSCSDAQAELLGRGFSEVYTLILDSLTVTSGNSNLIGVSVKDLIAVISPCMSCLVALQPDSVNKFINLVMERTSTDGEELRNDFLSCHWLLVFFFRLYMSCRSLYRQAISFVPPDTSRKMSGLMGDPFTAYSGRDSLERTDWTEEGYFSWIFQPAASLHTVIKAVSNFYLQDTVADYSSLIYVLNAMALQRLVDLNRLIKYFEYLLWRNSDLVQNKLTDEDQLSFRRKRKKSKKWLSDLRQEAACLTDFMMGYLPVLAKNQIGIPSSDDATNRDMPARSTYGNDEWNFCVVDVNKKSLPTAIWWIICQNIDIWCAHAAKKKLKMFISILIQKAIMYVTSSLDDLGKHINHGSNHLEKVTACQISFELLNDTVLYEQKFVRRHMASRFCQILEKSVLHILPKYGEVHLKFTPNWPEILNALENSLPVISDKKDSMISSSTVAESISHLSSSSPVEYCKEEELCPLVNMGFAQCQNLLKFLCWMPKGYLTSKSLSLYATYILNVERLVVASLLDCCGALHSKSHYELFRLFVSCRRALKNLIMASSEDKHRVKQDSLTSLLSESSFPVFWLSKSMSAVIGLQYAFPEHSATLVKYMTFSLMDHSAYVFLQLSKNQFQHSIRPLFSAGNPCEETCSSAVTHEQIHSVEYVPCLEISKDTDAWKRIVLVAETLKEQTRKVLTSLKAASCNEDKEVFAGFEDFRMLLSSIASSFEGFLWGLASAFDSIDVKNFDSKTKISWQKIEPICKVNLCIDSFADLIDYFLHMLLFEGNQTPENLLSDAQILPGSENGSHTMIAGESTSVETCEIHNSLDEDSGKHVQRKSNKAEPKTFLTEVHLVENQSLNTSFLLGFLRGEKLEAVFFLRQLFISASAMLRLNLQIKCTSLSSRSVSTLISISQVLLVEFTNKIDVPHPFSFVWLDGVVKFLEELGSHFPLSNPTLSRNMYVKLIELHLRALGKCISLQGKGATLASHETESSTKMLNDQIHSSEDTVSHGLYCLDEFKARLRVSFKSFVKKATELHLLSAIQAIERALVGVQEGFMTNYEICTGTSDGGRVSCMVASAIDCLDLVLEFIIGRKRVNVVRRHIQSLVACLFNIILHLQGPDIFYGDGKPKRVGTDPDPGSVILMCVEVLIRVFGKHALFQMDGCHVSQSLRLPAALFQNFLQLKISKAPAPSSTMKSSEGVGIQSVVSMETYFVDRRFSIELYAACCRLLCTIIKHYKSDSQRCTGLLEGSVTVLLYCLETVNTVPVVGKNYVQWEVQEGVKCACFLRRVYEEMRQQKDVFGRDCFHFLSNYIWVYCGYGPLKTGFRREIDDALRPGVYALIDVCSADDLQHLHTVFGEGPCRSTLATLQHDYKLNFQYGGKV